MIEEAKKEPYKSNNWIIHLPGPIQLGEEDRIRMKVTEAVSALSHPKFFYQSMYLQYLAQCSLTYPGDFERSASLDVLASLEPEAPRGVEAVAVQLHAQHVPIPESAIHVASCCKYIYIYKCIRWKYNLQLSKLPISVFLGGQDTCRKM